MHYVGGKCSSVTGASAPAMAFIYGWQRFDGDPQVHFLHEEKSGERELDGEMCICPNGAVNNK